MRPLPRVDHRAFDAAHLAAGKGEHTVAVCLPAQNEAGTVGAIVAAIREELIERVPLVDELVVVDDHSTDATGAAAAAAGAKVIDAATTLTEHAPGPGKGQALWKSLHETTSDIVVWCDADLRQFQPHFVTALVGALLTRPECSFVKGAYRRPLVDGDGGGRVTEILARPVLATLFPDLAGVSQPLSGEYGGRRRLLETLPFVDGYGVDLALLIDAVRAVGIEGVIEVHLTERIHRNRHLQQLGPQATAVLRAALTRAGLDDGEGAVVLHRPDLDPLLVPHCELPPLVELGSYRRRSA